MGLLEWSRREREVPEAVVSTVEARVVGGPEDLEGTEGLVGPGAPVLEPRVVASVELLQFAHTGAALPPSAVLDLVFVGSPKVCLDHATSESRIG